MDKMVDTKIAILNLIGELSPELSSYFAMKNILVVDPEVDGSDHSWTHILTKNIQDFTYITDTYQTIENDIKIISLTNVEDLQHFVVSNGKLILDELWMNNSLGPFILDKFLQEYGGIALGDNYPTFKEKGSFVITNPFNTGEYLDRMVHSAYTDGVSGLSIKTFFDHLVMYLTGLKTKGKLGMPIEVMYGFFEDVFGVQLHFFTKDLILEDVTSSLSSNISKQAEAYLLNIAVQSSDFFDFTLLKEVNKTVITGLWTKDERIKAENRGLLFNDLSASAGITSYPVEGITSYQTSNPTLGDFSDKIVLPASAVEEEFKTTVSGGEALEEDYSKVISGTVVEEEIINIVKGKIEEEEKVFKISGSKNFDIDKFAIRVSSDIEQKAKGEDFLKIKSLKNELPEAIKSSFHEFANKLNKTVDNISENEFETFNKEEIPLIIKQTTKKIDTQFSVKSLEPKAASKTNKEVDKAAELKMNSLNAENENLKSKLKTLMSEVKILKESKSQMAEMHSKAIQAAAAPEISVAQQAVINSDIAFKAHVIEKMNAQKSLNEQDSKKLTALLEKETKFLNASREHELEFKKFQIATVQKEEFVAQKLEKLNRLIAGKDLVINKAKEGFAKQVEQKDFLISNLNEKINQMNKLMANNQSQNQVQQIVKLEKELQNHEKMIEIYKNKMIQKPVTKNEDDSLKEENRRLHILSTQVKNQLEIAKKDMAKYQERMSQDLTVINSLKMDKTKLELQLKKAAQDAKKEVVANLNGHHQDQEFKKLQLQHDFLDSQLKEGVLRQRELEAKLTEALKNQKKDIISEDTNTKGKAAHLENNVRKLTQDLVESRNQLGEMKKETNKLRQEKTSLQNQLDKMKKDFDKSRNAAPKTPGNSGKAA